MRITNKLKGNEVKFEYLDHGDVFRYCNGNHVYMRMYEVESDSHEYNAVDLCDGDVAYFRPEEVVELIPDAELVI